MALTAKGTPMKLSVLLDFSYKLPFIQFRGEVVKPYTPISFALANTSDVCSLQYQRLTLFFKNLNVTFCISQTS